MKVIIKYVNYSEKFGDSSQWTTQARDDMAQSFKEITDSFALLTDDISWVPIVNTDYLSMW